jgi:hypothetical protein
MIFYSGFDRAKKYCWVFAVMLTFVGLVRGQLTPISFTDGSTRMPNYATYSSWLQKAVADMNGDGRDDIVRFKYPTGFVVEKQNVDGTFTEQVVGSTGAIATPLSVIVGDMDNNGFPDILTGYSYQGVYVLKANNDASAYLVTRLPQDSIFVQGSAMADLNNDGLLDLFVCHDEGTNGIWRNTSSGNFVRDSTLFNFSNIPIKKRAGNYAIVFTDFNDDGKLDAYLSKCYGGAPTDSTALERINQLFVNDGTGVLTDHAASYNMADGRQTWVTEFQDIDNDGDLDAFIANHAATGPTSNQCRLMLNDGTGHFTDISVAAGLGNMPSAILQSLMRDFDNDGYMDLIVAGQTAPKIYHNNGNTNGSLPQFTEIPTMPLYNPSGDNTTILRSFVIGDLNHDGFLDIYGSYRFEKDAPDRLWLNEGNQNHFLAITLMGTKSNRSAVGAKIKIQAGGKTFTREVRAGESYGISNSLTQTFGLGSETHIDKLTIHWPNGLTETKMIDTVDRFLTFVEPDCQIKAPVLTIKKN